MCKDFNFKNYNEEQIKEYKLKNGVAMPAVGLGTFPYKEQLSNIICKAVDDIGYRLIDTSDDYGNEIYLGNELKKCSNKKVFISTKYSKTYDIRLLEQSVYDSVSTLGRSIDLYLMHFPYPNLYLDIWKEMEKVYEKGLCKAIGVCNFEISHLQKLFKNCNIAPMVNQFELHPFFRQKELCDFCLKNDIQIMSYSPFAKMNEQMFANQSLHDIAEKKHVSISQIIMRWNLQHSYVAIPATAKYENALSNFSIWDFDLSENEMKIIDDLDCGMRIRYNPNTIFSIRDKVQFKVQSIKYSIIKGV